MDKINLKEVKECLNKIPDEELDKLTITHPYASDNSDDDCLKVIYYDDSYMEFFEKYDVKVLEDFAKQLFKDANIVFKVIENPETAEDYCDDC